MQSEHLSNVHAGYAALGWFVAIAVAAAVHLSLVATGFVPAGTPTTLANAAAILLGFFAGGLFVGLRWSDAPVLNGAAIVFCSAVVWLAASLLGPREVRGHLRGIDTVLTLGSLLVQLAAAVVGGLVGRSMVLRGQVPEPDSIPPEA